MWPIKAFLKVVGPAFAHRVRLVTYGAFARHVTPETRFWWKAVKRSFWLRWMARQPWSPLTRETIHAGGDRIAAAYRPRAARSLRGGTYIFSAFDQLSPRDAETAAKGWQLLADMHPRATLLNHPTRSLRRYELHRVLYEHGINHFNAYRVTERQWPERYPVFLRQDAHGGWKSALLHNRGELEQALEALDGEGRSRDDTLIVEFCDTADAKGIYRKYGTFVVGNRVIPKAVFFSKRWVLNLPDLQEEAMLREQREYVESNPHEDQLREIFKLARIEYGRIDYALRDGEIQVWEINTNPVIVSLRFDPGSPQGALNLEVLRKLATALEAIDADSA